MTNTLPAGPAFGEVRQVLAPPDGAHFRTAPVARLDLDLGGIPGDRHHGFVRPAGARERWYRKGTPIRSGRQLSLVSAEDLELIAQRLDLPGIDPGWIGANIMLRGIIDFTNLPWGTRMVFGEGAVLVNEGENAPCRYAGAEIAAHCPGRPGLDLAFVKAARNLRGIVASVERAGSIDSGTSVKLKLRQQKIWEGFSS